jgi:26S proteasome regulatory subunit N8
MEDPRDIAEDQRAKAEEEEEQEQDDAPQSSSSSRGLVPTAVDVHPLVLLSVVDHFTRINAKSSVSKRVVGLLLGNVVKGAEGEPRLDINSCFAVPFDESRKEPAVWFLDVNYAEEMWQMHKKVQPRIKVVGWYSSGPDIAVNDVDVHLLVAERFCPNPIYCIVNADPAKKGAPVTAYMATESRGNNVAVEFRNVHTNLGTVEAEEIGIEHLLRDLTDSTVSSLSTKVEDRHIALLQLETMLGTIETYLNDVANDRLPVNPEILELLQEATNIAPVVHQLKTSPGMLVATNDNALATMLASMSRTVTALYDVIVNRRQLRRAALEKQKAQEEEKKKKAADEEEEAKKKDADKKKKDGDADDTKSA